VTVSNGALVAGILSTTAGGNIATSGSDAKVNVYMSFLLFSVAGLAAIRFIGAAVCERLSPKLQASLMLGADLVGWFVSSSGY
jgi:hypothetical protein